MVVANQNHHSGSLEGVMELSELEEKIFTLIEEEKRREKFLQWLFVKTSGRMLLLNVAGIIWLEAQGNYVRVHHERGSHLLRNTIGALESQLNPRKFLRIHRSVIVQIDQIKELRRWLHGEYLVVLQNGTQLMLTRNYRSRLREAVGANL